MENCPVFDENKFMQTLEKIDKYNPEDHVIDSLKEITMEPCAVGGKRKKRVLTGGQIVTKRNIKIIIYLIIAGLVALAGTSPNSEVFTTGITMMINGQCSYLTNRLWGPFQNPVCIFWNNLVNAVLGALVGDPTSISMLVGAATITIGAPTTIAITVDTIASRIETGVNSQINSIKNTSNSQELANSGGKSKKTTKRASKKKTKKTTKRRNTQKHKHMKKRNY
jgi:hypothetical protein